MAKRNFRSKKNNNYNVRSKSATKEMDDSEQQRSTRNDPNWYAQDAALLRDAASIPYNWAIGTPIGFNQPNATAKKNLAIGGICAVDTVTAFGWSAGPTDALNVAANSLYTNVRYMNSGHTNYDAPDLMLYITAMTQVYSYISYLQRLYGMASLYAQRNRYLPDALIRASYGSANDIRNNMANFRYGINVLINKAASFAVPSTIPFFVREAFMYQNIYTEGESVKDQLYMYVPYGFYVYGLNTDGSGMLECKTLKDLCGSASENTVTQLLAGGNALLKPLIESEDMNIMSGDIKRAYGDNLIKLVSLPEDYPIVPVFSLEVLEQIKNATCVADVEELKITQDSTHAYLLFRPRRYIVSTTRVGIYDPWLDYILTSTHAAEATPEITMENTRLIARGSVFATDDTHSAMEIHAGSDIAVLVHYYRYDYTSGSPVLEHTNWGYVSTSLSFADACALSPFKYHPPIMVLASWSDTTGKYARYELDWDVDNYAVLSANDIDRLNDAAILNLLHTPSVGKL